MHILTIDSGTTNSRACLWRNGQVLARHAISVGVRDCAASGSNQVLKLALRGIIASVLEEADCPAGEVQLVLASGMITSGLGLYELPHVTAPAGVAELAARMHMLLEPDIIPQPIWLVPGVRNDAAPTGVHEATYMDMMRGEEVEALGLAERLRLGGPALLVLPGSHTKFVVLDTGRRIRACATTLAGEMLGALTNHTLLSASLDQSYCRNLNVELLRAGAVCARDEGLGRAAFVVRILERAGLADTDGRASFLLGAVLSQDVQALRASPALALRSDMPLYLAGRAQMAQAYATLLADDPYFRGQVTVLAQSQLDDLAGAGAISVATRRGLTQAAPSAAAYPVMTP